MPQINIFTYDHWTDCTRESSGKRPRINPGTPELGLPYDQALSLANKKGMLWGYLFTDTDPFIGLDVDVDPTGRKGNATREIPQPVLDFLQKHPTHVHYSPSGHGIHIIYALDQEGQTLMNEHSKYQGPVHYPPGLFRGDWRWNRSFLTFTRNLHRLCAPQIALITYNELSALTGPICETESADVDAPVIDINTGLRMQEHIPSIEELINTLKDIPPTLNVKAQRAVTYLKHSVPTTPYDYWLFVGQACAHTCIALRRFGMDATQAVTDAYVAWSAQDTVHFVSRKDVESKFRLLLRSTEQKIINKEPVVTYKALVILARRATLSFPVTAGKSRMPDSKSIRNYEYLFEHEELAIRHDTMADSYVITGPEDTIQDWFCPQTTYNAPRPPGMSQCTDFPGLQTMLLPFMQDRFRASVTPENARVFARHFVLKAEQTSAWRDWIDSTPWDHIPRLEPIVKSITFSDSKYADLYESYIRKSLLAMVGIHYFPEDHPKIPAMLVLKGPQRTYKSSWAEWLIPADMSQYLGMCDTETLATGATERDRLLATRAILVVNECETLFTPRYEQRVKASVDQEFVTYRDLYVSSPLSRRRTALIIGTTNKPDLYTGSLGSRKVWQIPVTVCDSMLVMRTNKQQLFAEIKYILEQYKLKHPSGLVQDQWALDDDDLERVEQLNRRERGSHGVDALLVEMFGEPEGWDDSYIVTGNRLTLRRGTALTLHESPNVWRLTHLLAVMKERFPDDFIVRKDLVYALARYCAVFTGTERTVKTVGGKKIIRGVLQYSSAEQLYVLPPVVPV
jgi:hypothetical protein